MPTTTTVLGIATSAGTLAGSTGSFDFLKDIVAPIAVGIFLMLLERWFGLTKILIRESKAEQNITRKIKSKLFIFGSHNTVNVNSGNREGYSASGEGIAPDPLGPPDQPRQPPQQDALNPRQVAICEAVLRVSIDHTTRQFDPRADYDRSIRELNGGDVPLGAGTFFRLFSHIVNTLENIVAINDRAGEQITNMRTVINGLDEMLNDRATEDQTLRNQIGACERAALQVISHLPYEAN